MDIAAKVGGKKVEKVHIKGPLGVRGRNSDNTLIREKLGWDYSITLEEGIKKTYEWIKWQQSKKIYSCLFFLTLITFLYIRLKLCPNILQLIALL